MGEIEQKDFGEPGGLNEILEECHMINRRAGQSLDCKGMLALTGAGIGIGLGDTAVEDTPTSL